MGERGELGKGGRMSKGRGVRGFLSRRK